MHLESGKGRIAPIYLLFERHRDFCSRLADAGARCFAEDTEGFVEKALLYFRHGVEVLFIDMLQGMFQDIAIKYESGFRTAGFALQRCGRAGHVIYIIQVGQLPVLVIE